VVTHKRSIFKPQYLPENFENKLFSKEIETTTSTSLEEIKHQFTLSSASDLIGGRNHANQILQEIAKYENYKDTRDFPGLNNTTKLSSYLKFGCISIREVYHQISKSLGKNHELIRQLYWRDFYLYIAFHFPYVFKRAFLQKYEKIPWRYNLDDFDKWKSGKTGYPIIDAGMRELNETGFMHNRIRMITASFLIKNLFLNWKWGMKYFAEKLIDHDTSVNNGSWQWAASTGVDSLPYFRIFNPWRQQKKFDKNCNYIKKWIPELRELKPKEIHNLEYHKIDQINESINYPKPMIDHRTSSDFVKQVFKEISIRSDTS
jgi:deoxyribodipyrimidine photo-lyase